MKYPSYTIPQSKKLQSALFWYHLFNSSESFLIKFCQNSMGINSNNNEEKSKICHKNILN